MSNTPNYQMQFFMKHNQTPFGLFFDKEEETDDTDYAVQESMTDSAPLQLTDHYGHTVRFNGDEVSHVVIVNLSRDTDLGIALEKRKMDVQRDLQQSANLRGTVIQQ